MPPTPFDPCKQWLGIDAVELVDPRRVLGIPPGESDPLAVLRAAEARLGLLRSVEPGPFAVARQALIQRVEEAREAVLQQMAVPQMAAPLKSAFPATGGLAMPPPPGGGVARPPAAVPSVPPAPQPPAAAPWPDDGAAPPSPAGGIAIRPTVVYRKSATGSGLLLVLILALAAAAGGLYWYKFHAPRRPAKHAAVVARAEPADTAAQVRPAPSPARSPRVERFGVADRVVSSDSPPPERRPTRRPEPPPTALKPPVEPPPPAAAAPGGPAQSAPQQEDTRRLDRLLGRTAQSLKLGDFAAARAAAEEAAGVAMSRASRERVERWGELVTFAAGFADFRRQALDAVKAGDEYDIDGKKIGVVEIDDKVFVYRFAGKNTRKPRDQIPGGILMAIVTGWFDDRPANELYIGAYHATKQEPDLDKARAAWESAERRGADASLLLPLLEDPLLVATE